MRFKPRYFFAALFLVVLAARLCHAGILWAEESLPLAAARQMLAGKALYRDVWFDKPPLLPATYLLWVAQDGWPLRLAGALYVLLACWIAWRFARAVWSDREGLWAAGLLGFFLTFDIASALMPLAADLLMLAPHLAAVWFAWKRRALWCGVLLGVAFLVNPKAVFVGAACALWYPAGIPLIAAGFAVTSGIALLILFAGGSLPGYWEQVWRWGSLYASAPLTASPWRNGLMRTLDWAGFHAALVIAAAWFFARSKNQKLQWAAWCMLCLAGALLGGRFFPRYYFLLLPPMVLMAARGLTLLGRRAVFVTALLLIPAARFGPRYLLLATGRSDWTDTAMDRESRDAGARLRALAHPGDTLFVWGFRPEIYVYSRLTPATQFLDSQPLTGVPADRHLVDSTPLETTTAAARRRAVAQSHPAFLVDGLGLYNPRLAMTQYPELQEWLSGYREIARTGGTVLYVSRSSTTGAALAP